MTEPHINTTFLIVEDDPVVAMNHLALVDSCGYKAEIARDGCEALEAFRQRTFRLVICDWELPVKNGLEVCMEVRKMGLPYYVYFILVTLRDKPADLVQGMNAGVDDFITKPLTRDKLRVRLRVAARILGFQQAIDRLQSLIPVCMYCGALDAGRGDWMKPVEFLEKHLECHVSHGICPTCFHSGVPNNRRNNAPKKSS